MGEELNIDWDKEMEDVRTMIKTYNEHYHLLDKDVRAIILKAHGSQDLTRTAAFNRIKLKRADFLIQTATNPGPYKNVAEAVVEAMGVHKRGGSFASGAVKLLAEKLG